MSFKGCEKMSSGNLRITEYAFLNFDVASMVFKNVVTFFYFQFVCDFRKFGTCNCGVSCVFFDLEVYQYFPTPKLYKIFNITMHTKK